MGQLSFIKNTDGGIATNGGYFYDYTDEKEAHVRGSIFGATNYSYDIRLYPGLRKNANSFSDNYQRQYELRKKKNMQISEILRYKGVTY